MTKLTLILAALLLSIFCSAQTRPVSATIFTSKPRSPISKYIYGQFLEYIGGIVTVKSPEDSATPPFFPRAMLASAAAWSPDPQNPPLYLDLPMKDGQPQPEALAKWTTNSPLAFIDQYIDNLRKYRAISIDVGDQDGLRVDTTKLHDILDEYGIKHGFEIYHGTHTSAVADRFQNHVMRFFSQSLCSTADWQ
ncbi:MAG TPA: hypothetical protein VIJ38_11605 [Acidobacteriaceae bacterium]